MPKMGPLGALRGSRGASLDLKAVHYLTLCLEKAMHGHSCDLAGLEPPSLVTLPDDLVKKKRHAHKV